MTPQTAPSQAIFASRDGQASPSTWEMCGGRELGNDPRALQRARRWPPSHSLGPRRYSVLIITKAEKGFAVPCSQDALVMRRCQRRLPGTIYLKATGATPGAAKPP